MQRYKIPDSLDKSRFIVKSVNVNVSTYGHLTPVPEGFKIMEATRQVLSIRQGGYGFQFTNIGNYTNSPIVVLDQYNRVQLIPPAYIEHRDQMGLMNCISIEMINGRAATNIGATDTAFKCYQSESLLRKGTTTDNYYKEDLSIIKREDTNHLQQIIITDVEDVLSQYDGAFYIREADLVIFSLDAKKVFVHPSTPTETLVELDKSLGEEDSVSVELFLNDPEHHYDRGFVNLAGKVTEVPIHRKPTEDKGIFYRQCKINKNRKRIGELVRHELEDETCPIKVYKSRVEAEHHGSVDKEVASLKAKAEVLRNETELVKSQTEQVKSQTEQVKSQTAQITAETTNEQTEQKRRDFERESMEKEFAHRTKVAEEALAQARAKAEAELKKLQAEREKLKAENERKLEKASFARKMLVEGAKLAATILTTVASVVAFMKLRAG